MEKVSGMLSKQIETDWFVQMLTYVADDPDFVVQWFIDALLLLSSSTT